MNNALLPVVVKSTEELVNQSGVSQRYVAQIIKLAYLSPTITSRVFKGDMPYDLTLGKLKRRIPWDWAEQKNLFSWHPIVKIRIHAFAQKSVNRTRELEFEIIGYVVRFLA